MRTADSSRTHTHARRRLRDVSRRIGGRNSLTAVSGNQHLSHGEIEPLLPQALPKIETSRTLPSANKSPSTAAASCWAKWWRIATGINASLERILSKSYQVYCPSWPSWARDCSFAPDRPPRSRVVWKACFPKSEPANQNSQPGEDRLWVTSVFDWDAPGGDMPGGERGHVFSPGFSAIPLPVAGFRSKPGTYP